MSLLLFTISSTISNYDKIYVLKNSTLKMMIVRMSTIEDQRILLSVVQLSIDDSSCIFLSSSASDETLNGEKRKRCFSFLLSAHYLLRSIATYEGLVA